MKERPELWRLLARAAVRMYPRDWQARYGREMQVLVDDSDVRFWTVVDILAAAIVEQGRWVWTAIFGDRRPLNELASIVLTSLVTYWVFFRLLVDVDRGLIGHEAWVPANLLRLAFLLVRTYLIVKVGLAMIEGLNGRLGDRANRWWIRGAERVLSLFGLMLVDELGSRWLHWWQSANDLHAAYGGLSLMVLFVTFFELADRSPRSWSDTWREVRLLAGRAVDPDKTL